MTKCTLKNMGVNNMITPLERLRMKHTALTRKEKADLIGQLTLDEKLLFASYLMDDEIHIETLENSGMHELDGKLSFGSKTYEDGMETFVNNKE